VRRFSQGKEWKELQQLLEEIEAYVGGKGITDWC
jgi:hypothetical protein